jgi:hypothetical protein
MGYALYSETGWLGLLGSAVSLGCMHDAVSKQYRLLKDFFDAGYTSVPNEVAAEIDRLVENKRLSADSRKAFKVLAQHLRKAKEIAIISES